MFESQTYEAILDRMLKRIPDTYDKQEGSPIWNALSPEAIEIAQAFIVMATIIKETFADTAGREYLIRRAKEHGVYPKEATAAVRLGTFNKDIELGERFTCGSIVFYTSKRLGEGSYQMTCETVGSIGNQVSGPLVPINYIEGLESAELSDILIPGNDEEDTEVFIERYLNSFDALAWGGNKQDYINKVSAIDGVGGVKVYKVWQGAKTVKLTIIDSTYHRASDTLVDTVQQIIDPTRDGEGEGQAPMWHIVTVDTVGEVTINIQTRVTVESGYTFEMLKPAILEQVSNYLETLRMAWQSSDNLIVRIAQIDSRILSVEGVTDVRNTMINGSSENLELQSDEIPVIGDIVNA